MKRTKYDPNEIIVENNICRMKLYNNKGEEVAETIFDLKYKSEIEKYKWHFHQNYVVTTWYDENNKQYNIQLHQAIIQMSGQVVPDGYEIDHKDINSLNNLENNLRICTRSQNQQNRGKNKNNSSNFKGVTWHNNNEKWQAQIVINNKKQYLGYFSDKKDAAIAYNNAALQHHGEFAQLNQV